VGRAKFAVGEAVEMRCLHRQAGRMVVDWLPGRVSAADYRMLGVTFDMDVFANSGQVVPDRTLWCTHGSPNLRRPGERAEADRAAEENSHD
jgi:hypothetical protein